MPDNSSRLEEMFFKPRAVLLSSSDPVDTFTTIPTGRLLLTSPVSQVSDSDTEKCKVIKISYLKMAVPEVMK